VLFKLPLRQTAGMVASLQRLACSGLLDAVPLTEDPEGADPLSPCRRAAEPAGGYHARSRAEAKMRCLKSFGERIAARDPDRQTAEIHIRVALINRFNALGTAEIVHVP
jgi:hypothetical protein